ncbi:MAG: cytochrome P450 [Anaerolineales bacterium]|nr:cytochrome P450 [Anaerolineales bacterium]
MTNLTSLSAARHSRAQQAIPGPAGQPLLGHMLAFQQDRLGFLRRLQRDFGDVARYRLAHLAFVQISHPDGVRHILQEHHRNYQRGAFYAPVRKLIGNGLPASDGDFWLRQRRLMQPAFHHRIVDGFAGVVTDATQALLARWQPGETLDVSAELARLTMSIVSRALFSTPISDDGDTLGQAVAVVLQDIAYRFEVPFYPPPAVPTPRNRRFRAAAERLDRLVYGLIAEREARPEAAPDDLLTLLVTSRDAETGEAMSPQQLRDELLALFVAGHETTANALSWALYLLAQHPDAAARLRAEVAQALDGRTPALADLPNLPYTRQVLDETMRLYPPAWIFNRTAQADDEIGGYFIPAGTTVAFSQYVTHRHPDFWEDPDRFDPERFTPERSAERPAYAYFPFGGGPHKCIGQGLALMEAHLALALIAQRAQWALVPGRPVTPEAHVTLRPRGGLWMTLGPRA